MHIADIHLYLDTKQYTSRNAKMTYRGSKYQPNMNLTHAAKYKLKGKFQKHLICHLKLRLSYFVTSVHPCIIWLQKYQSTNKRMLNQLMLFSSNWNKDCSIYQSYIFQSIIPFFLKISPKEMKSKHCWIETLL